MCFENQLRKRNEIFLSLLPFPAFGLLAQLIPAGPLTLLLPPLSLAGPARSAPQLPLPHSLSPLEPLTRRAHMSRPSPTSAHSLSAEAATVVRRPRPPPRDVGAFPSPRPCLFKKGSRGRPRISCRVSPFPLASLCLREPPPEVSKLRRPPLRADSLLRAVSAPFFPAVRTLSLPSLSRCSRFVEPWTVAPVPCTPTSFSMSGHGGCPSGLPPPAFCPGMGSPSSPLRSGAFIFENDAL
jgi:hypothetical protein